MYFSCPCSLSVCLVIIIISIIMIFSNTDCFQSRRVRFFSSKDVSFHMEDPAIDKLPWERRNSAYLAQISR